MQRRQQSRGDPLFTLPPRQYRAVHCRSGTPTQLQTVIGSWSLASDPHPLRTTTLAREMVSDQVDSVDKGIGLGGGGGGCVVSDLEGISVCSGAHFFFSCCCTLKPSCYILKVISQPTICCTLALYGLY